MDGLAQLVLHDDRQQHRAHLALPQSLPGEGLAVPGLALDAVVHSMRHIAVAARAYRQLPRHDPHVADRARSRLLGREHEYLLVWTTTPWTLAANVAAAVHPDLDYAVVRQGDDTYYLSQGTLATLDGPYEVLRTVKGSELVGLRYEGPFDYLPAASKIEHRVVAWEEVSEVEGTGIVHIAPGCGAEDFALSKTENLAVIVPIDENGDYYDGFDWLSQRNALAVASEVAEDLRKRGRLYWARPYHHRYPVCWRCSSELVFRLVDEWFLSAQEIRPLMIAAARKVEWVPDHAGKRMEDWLNNMGDWCISRKRYWGLPLPFYTCGECGRLTVVGSVEELAVARGQRDGRRSESCIARGSTRCGSSARNCGTTVSRVHRGRRLLARRRHRPILDACLQDRPRLLGEVVPGRAGPRDARADPALVLLDALHEHRR